MTAGVQEAGAPALTVLFVDDEPALARATARIVAARSGFHALTAASGAEALEVLRTHAVDVLVSDIDMPEMDGIELVRVARREFPMVLRILLTGAGTMERAVNAINEGEVVRFFAKPFDIERFTAALAELADRIAAMRRERYAEAQRERCNELFRWIDERYAGTLEVERGEEGEVVIDVARLATFLGSASEAVRGFVK